MLFDDTYKTISIAAQGVFTDRGSKFIAYTFPIRSDSEVKKLISQIKTEHPKGAHYCWAFRISPDRSIFKLNDDGEPPGTAGRPILNTLLSFDVTDMLVIVVRYFGGTLLGVPGLINAYKTATTEALNASQIISKTLNDVYRIDFDYIQMNAVMKVLKEESLTFRNQTSDVKCSLEVEIRKSNLNLILEKFNAIQNLKFTFLQTI
jgi:uncharacterized YigZ family protein